MGKHRIDTNPTRIENIPCNTDNYKEYKEQLDKFKAEKDKLLNMQEMKLKAHNEWKLAEQEATRKSIEYRSLSDREEKIREKIIEMVIRLQ